ncbi:neurofilament heavy polypeptide-like isoform X2 [Clinocottus analis]|uniref:neurofilament heavy polypeptide-like isoform X2 n=1 Tax=Clinocottus analis TaxID=304258 RepID=UPI0035C0D687
MYQGDTQRHEAQPQDGPKKEAQVEVKEISAQNEMKDLRAPIPEKEEAILDLTEKLNLEIKLRSESESNAKVLYSEREYLKNRVEGLAINLETQTKLVRDSGEAWHLRFSALEESNEKEKASGWNLRATIQEKEEAILDLTEKLNLEIKLRSKSESNANILYSEREYLKNKVEGLAINLEAQTKLGCDSGKAWQSRFSALEEESYNKEKASESHFRATIQEKEEAILDLTKKLNLEIKLRSDSESNANILYSEREYLKNKVEGLAINLEAQTKLGCDSGKAWQSRFSALEEESYNKEKASESHFRATIQEKEEAILDLTEKLNLEIKLRSESESNAKALYSEREHLEDEVKSLTNNLEVQTNLARYYDNTWQSRFSALEEESHNKEKASELSLKALLTECQDMENKIQSLSEDLKAQTKLVSDNDKAWKDQISTLKREHVLKEKTIRTAAHVEREVLLQKLKEQSCKMHSLQVKYQGEQNDNEEEFWRLRRQIVNLEDICLRQKKKNLGFFGRRMEDREVELERMKRKVPAREPFDRPAPVHCPSPVQCPPPVQCRPPVQCPSPVDPTPPVQCPSPVDPTPPAQCPPPVQCPSPVDPTPPVHCPSPVDPTPPVQCPSPVDPTPPVHCPSPVDPTPPVHCPSPVDPTPPVHLSDPPTSSSTPSIAKALCLVRLP